MRTSHCIRPVVLSLVFLVALVNAQNRAAHAKGTSLVPRTADGKPDLSGVYQGGSTRRGTWEEANNGVGSQGLVSAGAARGGPALSLNPEEAPPYQAWAAAKMKEFVYRRAVDDPGTTCLPPGVPRINFGDGGIGIFPMKIVQTPTAVLILYEYQHMIRDIPLNAKHREDIGPTFMGDSVGHWERDTLVVDVTNFNDGTWLHGTGTIHSEALHVTERYTRVDKDQINYEAIVEDPNVFTKPWRLHQTFMLRNGTRLTEYVCEENNLDAARIQKIIKEDSHFATGK